MKKLRAIWNRWQAERAARRAMPDALKTAQAQLEQAKELLNRSAAERRSLRDLIDSGFVGVELPPRLKEIFQRKDAEIAEWKAKHDAAAFLEKAIREDLKLVMEREKALTGQLQSAVHSRDAYARRLEIVEKKLEAATRPFPVVDYYDEPLWVQEDAARWRAFLGTETGQKMQRLANFLEQATNRKAVTREGNEESTFANNCGSASGWSLATRYFFNELSADLRPQQESDTQEGDEASRLRERLA